jgi:glucarate dehydratase
VVPTGPNFIRNLVLLEDNAGHTGLGEVPGGEALRTVLEQSQLLVVGTHVGDRERVLESVGRRFTNLDAGSRGVQTYDQRVAIHAMTAIESALLDLLGKLCSAKNSRKAVLQINVTMLHPQCRGFRFLLRNYC